MNPAGFTMKLPLGVEFAHKRFDSTLFQEMLPMLVAHWQEVAHFKDIPLDPDLKFYTALESAGVLRTYTARRAGELCGYAVFVLRFNPHYKTNLQAIQDIVYLDPSARGKLGLKFLKFCDEELRAEKVQAVYHHVKASHNFGLVLQRIGYELVDLIYTRRLDKE